MPARLNDFSPDKLVLAIEESMREFWRNWGQAPQCELYDLQGMLRLYSGIPYGFFNAVICTQALSEDVDAKIDETTGYFAARNATWEWAIGPDSNPASLDKALERHGLAYSGEDIGMAINLHAMREDFSTPNEVSIVQANDDDALILWASTVAEGFEAPALIPGFIELELALGSQRQSYRRYLGLLNQHPVSTCALYLGDNVAGIYCVSTLPSARRLGIGAAITRYALDEAKAAGYHVAVLQSSPMGRNVYRQMGFQEFSLLRMYSPAV